jgi:pre-mRNA-processing factor 6
MDKARDWLNRAVTVNPDLGDAWAHFYKLELLHGTKDEQQGAFWRWRLDIFFLSAILRAVF